LLNRAHAYKAATDANREKNEDTDAGVTAGLYMYPVLMAADILIFNANKVPVGRDQVQHIEMARDIGQRFNHIYGGEFFALPEAAIEENVATLPGTDGRKMSKSYDNTIPLWLPEKDLRKAILGVVTNSQAPGEAKNPDESNLFAIYQAFASADETAAMRRAYADGIGWGDAKQQVFERVNAELAPLREKYAALVADPAQIEDRLRAGAARARRLATPFVARLREAVGLRSLSRSSAAPEPQKKARVEKPNLQPVVFRDGETFAFKVLDAKKTILAEKGGFADPKAAMAAAREVMSKLAS
jgi:tryptophanyl-tRNA synthetase